MADNNLQNRHQRMINPLPHAAADLLKARTFKGEIIIIIADFFYLVTHFSCYPN